MKPGFAFLLASATIFLTAGAEESAQKLDSLTTTKGKVYSNVTVREITPSGVKVLHDSGTATIPYQELPADVQRKLGGFDPAKAEKHRIEIEKKHKNQEAALDREIETATAEDDKSPAAGTPAKPGKPAPAAPAPTPAAKDSAATPATAEKGILSARIVGYRKGIKNVEFKVIANCKTTLTVTRVIPDEHSIHSHTDQFTVEPNTNFVRQIWVYNDYNSSIRSESGKELDAESATQKTDTTGGLARPTLR